MSAISQITEQSLRDLRADINQHMSEKRYHHTLAVEKEIAKLGEVYLPHDIPRLRVAALLHDLTKELSYTEQITLCQRHNIPLTEAERLSPKTLHAITAPAVIALEYPAWADKIILRAVREHTTGARNMDVFSKLLYLADYIEETRTFDDCVRLRDMFWSDIENLPQTKLQEHLDRVLIASFDMTIASLLNGGGIIAPESIEARNSLIEKISTHI